MMKKTLIALAVAGFALAAAPYSADAQMVRIKTEAQAETAKSSKIRVGSYMPLFDVMAFNGTSISMVRLRGKPVLVEFIDPREPQYQSLAGAGVVGGLYEVVQENWGRTIGELLPYHGRGLLHDSDEFAHVRIILNNDQGQRPTPDDLSTWIDHFGIDLSSRDWVVGASRSVMTDTGRRVTLQPGFIVLDDKLVVQSVSFGDEAKSGLTREIIPTLASLLGYKSESSQQSTAPSAPPSDNRLAFTNDDLLYTSAASTADEAAPATNSADAPSDDAILAMLKDANQKQEKAPASRPVGLNPIIERIANRKKAETPVTEKKPGGGKVIPVSQVNFNSVVLEAEGMVVVDFYADWCGPCKMMEPEYKKFASANKDVLVAKLDVDDNKGLAQKYGIRSLPTTIYFKNGEPVGQIIGFHKAESLEKALKQVR